jgi:hypothetical protein
MEHDQEDLRTRAVSCWRLAEEIRDPDLAKLLTTTAKELLAMAEDCDAVVTELAARVGF